MYKLDRQLLQRQQESSRPREIGVPSCLRTCFGLGMRKGACFQADGRVIAAAITAANGANRHGLERSNVLLLACPRLACYAGKIVRDPVVIPCSCDTKTQKIDRHKITRCAKTERPPVSSSPYQHLYPTGHDDKNRRWCRSDPASGRRPRARHSAGGRQQHRYHHRAHHIKLQLHRLSQLRPRCRWSAKRSCLACLS